MRRWLRALALLLAAGTLAGQAAGQGSGQPGYWPPEKVAAVLSRTEPIRLAPDLSQLTAGERRAVDALIAAGRVIQDLYEDTLHPEALAVRARLTAGRTGLPAQANRDLLTLYRLFGGPMGTTADGAVEPFAPVSQPGDGRNVYPAGIERTEIDAFLKAHPEDADTLLAERTVVRRATTASLKADRKALADPTLRTLHPAVARQLEVLARRPDPARLYAVPQAVAWAGPLRKVYAHLLEAADALEHDDADFAGYLRNRARDLLTNNYESGDAAWVTGRFRHLNASIGSYESYRDGLYGAKAFPELSLLLADDAATRELRTRIRSLQAVEDALPYDHHKRIREDIPVGVYDIIADFGHARGTNTATILPNNPTHTRRYGRTILLRRNILEDPGLNALELTRWQAAVAAPHAGDLTPAGGFQRTLWHEIGHYLGVDRDRQGRALDVALGEYSDSLEEMKADLVSLFTIGAQAQAGAVTPAGLREAQASGIMRTLLLTEPRRNQPYGRMQLAQFNYFRDRGLIEMDATGRVRVHHERYPATVTAMLREVLALQYEGDQAAAAACFTKWTAWTPELHQRLATAMRGTQGLRFRLMRYAALGE